MSPAVHVRLLGDDDAEAPRIAADLAVIERSITYPLGTDRFRIDHGGDYFAFFRGMGAVRIAVAEHAGRVAGVLVGALRDVATDQGVRRAWYLGDLKVDPRQRMPGLGARLIAAFERDARRLADAGFAVAMDPARGGNPLVRAATRWDRRVQVGPRLEIHACDRDGFERLRAALAPRFGPLALESLSGVKDIVLASTGQPMALWHVRRAPAAPANPMLELPADAVCMLCARRDGALAHALAVHGSAPTATATILQRGLDDADWTTFSSADI